MHSKSEFISWFILNAESIYHESSYSQKKYKSIIDNLERLSLPFLT